MASVRSALLTICSMMTCTATTPSADVSAYSQLDSEQDTGVTREKFDHRRFCSVALRHGDDQDCVRAARCKKSAGNRMRLLVSKSNFRCRRRSVNVG